MNASKTVKVIKWAAVTVLTIALLTGLGSAQEKNQEQQPDYKVFNVKSRVWKSAWGAEKTVVLSGDVVITQGDTTLKSDKITYNEDSRVATSPGRLTISDPESDITGDSGVAYLKQRLAKLQGNIKLIVKPKPKQDTASKPTQLSDNVVITCDTLDYLYKEKQATAAGNLTMVQKDRTVTAEKGVYDAKNELLTLTGSVKGHDEKGQTVSAGGKAVISFKEGDEWMEVEQASGTFKVNLEEEEEKGGKAADKAKS